MVRFYTKPRRLGSVRLDAQARGGRWDVRVLRLIGAYLRAGVKLPEGSGEATTQGVPQGGALSPLLAKIMLDPLDKELERRGLRFARYAIRPKCTKLRVAIAPTGGWPGQVLFSARWTISG